MQNLFRIVEGDIFMILSIAKAFRILDCFSKEKNEMSLSEISQITQIPPSSCRRILGTLMDLNVVEQNQQTRGYCLGNHLLFLGKKVIHQNNLLKKAHPLMKRLVSYCNETAYLAINGGSNVIYLDVVESRQTIRLTAIPGETRPIHSTATGKALLAFSPYEEVEKNLKFPLEAFSGKTITKKVAFVSELEKILKKGYATSYGEHDPEVCAVAAPVIVREELKAAISISGPIYRISPARLEEIALNVVEIANELGESLEELK